MIDLGLKKRLGLSKKRLPATILDFENQRYAMPKQTGIASSISPAHLSLWWEERP